MILYFFKIKPRQFQKMKQQEIKLKIDISEKC